MTEPSAADHKRQLDGIAMRATRSSPSRVRSQSAIVVRREPVTGPPVRDRYEPRDAGGWERIEERWSGCRWVIIGSELVEDVAIEADEEREA